jgi:P-type E1-E2 ATPase
VIYVAHQRQLIGLIEVQDKIREEARATLKRLRATGVRLMLLTGDSEEAAKAVSQAVGIDSWRAGPTFSKKRKPT